MCVLDVVDTLTLDPALLLMVVGSLTFFITFLGCVGALRNAGCMLKTVNHAGGAWRKRRAPSLLMKSFLLSAVCLHPGAVAPPAAERGRRRRALHRRGRTLAFQHNTLFIR